MVVWWYMLGFGGVGCIVVGVVVCGLFGITIGLVL